ncbi:MAG TPA: TlyA family RNA methyltransferase [Solirubrobacteraceae bacterium]|nr:TlyA family RNA methyltransferase [Solirubrobacteraceae bacterium]
MEKRRLDQLLVDRGLFDTRSRAAAAVLAGDVRVGPGRERAAKAGQPVPDDIEIEVAAGLGYVSRGGIKLANALDTLGLAVAGRRCLDVGASTGGFTDCLLQRGASHVIALDVAYGELAWSVREDPRVSVIERCNARSLERATLPYAPDLIVIDVSFISLTKVLPAVLAVAAEPFDCLAMVKPQFEVGRERLGKGGVVREAALRREVLVEVARAGLRLGARVGGFASSGLPGPKGNRESFVWLRHGGESVDVEAAALAVEP